MAVATTVAWGLAAFALAAAVFALLRARSLGAQLRAALARAAREEQEGRERESAWRGRARSGQERDAFFDVSLDLLAVADLTRGSIRQLNPAWERLLGFPPADLASRPLLDLVHPDDRERTRAEVQRLRLGGAPSTSRTAWRGTTGPTTGSAGAPSRSPARGGLCHRPRRLRAQEARSHQR